MNSFGMGMFIFFAALLVVTILRILDNFSEHIRANNRALTVNRERTRVMEFVPPIPAKFEENRFSLPGSEVNSLATEDEIFPAYDSRVFNNASYSQNMPLDSSEGHRRCTAICAEIFPETRILHNVKSPSIANPDTSRNLEIDIVLVDLGIGIEYQGEQHFGGVTAFGGDESTMRQIARDHIKAVKARAAGIILVTVPYTYTDDTIREILMRLKSRRSVDVRRPPVGRPGNVAYKSRLFRQ